MSDDFNSRLTAQFRKKPVVITALQWTGENLVEALAFTGKHPKWNEWFEDYKAYEKYVKANGNIFKIFTLEGTMEASPGDWIIRGVKGEHYPCKPDIFAATYEPAALPAAQPVQGEAVADVVRGVWGRCEALEDEAYAKLESDGLTDHERGFWSAQKMVAKSIRRSTEMPTPTPPDSAGELDALVAEPLSDRCVGTCAQCGEDEAAHVLKEEMWCDQCYMRHLERAITALRAKGVR